MKSKNLIDLSVFLRGDALDPELVSSVLSLSPSSSQKKGDVRKSPFGSQYVTQIGVWELAATCDSEVLSEHIEELTSKMTKTGSELLAIEGVEEAYADLFIGVEADEENEGLCEFELTEANLAALAKLSLPIRFAVSYTKK